MMTLVMWCILYWYCTGSHITGVACYVLFKLLLKINAVFFLQSSYYITAKMTKLTKNYCSPAKYKGSCVLDHTWKWQLLYNVITQTKLLQCIKKKILRFEVLFGGVERYWQSLVYCVVWNTTECHVNFISDWLKDCHLRHI